ncbi:MAG: hypothetical protein HKN75_00225 [Bacteroidia bacterium]|nr:hypothetical protein [Bacteroidia bacterium]
MKKLTIYVLLFSLIAFSPIQLVAQDEDDLGNETVNVIKAFEPTLRDSKKIGDVPSGDTSTAKVPTLSYDIQPNGIVPAFNITPIKAFKLKENTISKLYNGYVKAGYGTRNSPLAEVYYNNKRSKDKDIGVYLKHYSAGGKVKDRGKTNNSKNVVNVFANKYFDDTELNADVLYNRDVVRYYGFNSNNFDYTKKETKHRFNDINATVGFKSNHTKEERLSYHTKLGFTLFEDNRDAKENLFNVQFGAARNFDIHRFGLNADLDFVKVSFDNDDANRNVLRFDPYYEIKRDLLELHAGLNFTAAKTNNSKAYVYPDVQVLFSIIRNKLVLRAHGKGYLKDNTLKSVSQENPFMVDSMVLNNSSVPLELRGTLSGTIAKNIQVNGTAAIITEKDALFFLNQPISLDFPQTFRPIYDDLTTLNLGAEVNVNTTKKIGGGASLNVYSYSADNLDKALHKPNLKMTVFAHYKLQDKIELKTDWFLRSGMFAFDYVEQKPEKIDGWLDANFNIQYNYSKILSVFLQLNNVTASRYEYWYNYPTYRFHALAGLSYSF